MPTRKLESLVNELATVSVSKPAAGTVVRGITNDSRQVLPGFLYAALYGRHVDGHLFIDEAIGAGASAVLCAVLPDRLEPGVSYLRADNPRLALSEISDAFFGRPSRSLRVVGVTGTDGKTSTVYFSYQLLRSLGANVGFLSTAAVDLDGRIEPNRVHQSTPEAPEVHRALAEIAANGREVALLESTSHGLSAKSCRLAHVAYTGAVLTNLTHEHLEYHGSIRQYRHDKANLFRAVGTHGYSSVSGFDALVPIEQQLAEKDASHAVTMEQLDGPFFGVANRDDPAFWYFAAQTAQPVLSYSVEGRDATIRVVRMDPSASGTRFVAECGGESIPVELPVPGIFNVANVLAAMLTTAALTRAKMPEIAAAVTSLESIRGRMNVVCSEPFSVVVDYAHTPGSFASTLPFFQQYTAGRLIVLFGSGGERDKGKRPEQGRVAADYADIVVLADEDPRGENQMAILEEIASGITTLRRGESLHLIPDRREAIRLAIETARQGDTLLLLGKGHETSIIGSSGPEPWDEIEVVREELRRAGLV